jgi:hypothetical protein
MLIIVLVQVTDSHVIIYEVKRIKFEKFVFFFNLNRHIVFYFVNKTASFAIFGVALAGATWQCV